MSELDDAILKAHAARDGEALIGLYEAAAGRAEGEARPFFLTQAWVHALESGDARAAPLARRLRELGRL